MVKTGFVPKYDKYLKNLFTQKKTTTLKAGEKGTVGNDEKICSPWQKVMET